MHFYFAFALLAVSFLINAQQLPDSGTINQRYYELRRYHTDPETEILFEQAKYKLAKDPQDEDGKSTMALLAERWNPYIPALLYNTRKAIEQKNLNEAFRLSYKGSQLVDPQSLYTHATLLLNSPEVPLIANCDPRELEFHARTLLKVAAVPDAYLPQAKRALEILENDGRYRAKRTVLAHTFLLNNVSGKTRELAEQEANENENTLFASYFIKRNLKQENSSEDLQDKALDLFEHLVTAPLFDYNGLKLYGAYEAVQAVADNPENPHHARAAFLLGYMERLRLQFDSTIDGNTVEKYLIQGTAHDPRAFLMLAGSTPDAKTKIKYLDELTRQLNRFDNKEEFLPIVVAIIRGYHSTMHGNEAAIAFGIGRLLKHKAYREIRDELCRNPDLAGEMGAKLLQMSTHDDQHKSNEEGITLSNAAGAAQNDRAIWALAEYCLQTVGTESQKETFNDMFLQAICASQARVDNNQTPLVPKDDLHRMLQKVENAPLTSENYHALGQWYLQGVPGYIERDEIKAIRYFSEAKNGIKAICQAMQEGQINNPRACFNAAVLLHQADSAAYQNERLLLFGKASLYADLSLKKEIINYCLEHQELVEQAVWTIDSYLAELKQLSDLSDAEYNYQQTFTNTLMQWATGTKKSKIANIFGRHPAAIMYFYQWTTLTEYAGALKPAAAENIKELVYWAATNGHEPALRALEPEFETIPQEIPSLSRAVAFWESWLKVYRQAADKEQKKQLIADKIDRISVLCMPKRPNGSYGMLNPETHYQLSNMLMNRAPERAFKHIFIAELLIRSSLLPKEGFQLIDKIGTYQHLLNASQRGDSWAKYALAGIKVDRIEAFVEEHINDPQACFAEVDAAKKLFTEASSFIPDADELMLAQGQMDYMESYVAGELDKRKADPAIHKRGLRALESAVNQGYTEAFYTWADNALVGELGIGQEIFEKAVDRLCIAIEKGNREAGIVLRNIYMNGFDCVMQCGGLVTRAMREKIIATMAHVKVPVHPVNEPTKGSVAYGLYLLNRLENFDTAYTIFKNAAEAGDASAQVYLGIMYRDGMGVERSKERAQEYFLKALRASRSKKITPMEKRALNTANEALRVSAENDSEISAERCRHIIDSLEAKDFDLNFALVMDDVEALEKVLTHSDANETKNRLFTSGLMKSLVNICVNSKSINQCMRIAKMSAHRCLTVDPATLLTSKDLALLAMPFACLRDLLDETNLHVLNVKAAFVNVDPKEIEQLMHLLERMVARGYHEPYEETLGTLKVAYGIATNDSKLAQVGMANWEHAEKQGDLKAAYMWALVKMRGEQMVPPAERLIMLPDGTVVKKRVNGFFTTAPNVGIAKLEALAAKGHLPAVAFLGQWYLENNDAVSALEWYKLMVTAKPDLAMGAMGFLESISREFAKASEDDRKLIAPALECTQKNNAYATRGGLCASYLCLIKKYNDITPEQALDYIVKVSMDVSTKDHCIGNFLKDTQFIKKFAVWLAPFENKKNSCSDEFLAKVHLAYGLLLFMGTRNEQDSTNTFLKIQEECDKVLKLKSDSLDAESLKALTSYLLSDAKTMKLSVMKCCKILQDKKLKLDSSPILRIILSLIQMRGGNGGNIQDRIIVATGNSIQEMINDVAWATAIAKKFSASETPANVNNHNE